MINLPPNDHDFNAWLDDRLPPTDRQRLDAWLGQNPDQARRLRAQLHDAQQLRAAMSGALTPPPNPVLDPTAIRQQLHQRRRQSLARAAGLAVAVALGSLGGWQLRGWQSVTPAPMGDALQAYRLFAQQGMLPADLQVADRGTLQGWLDRWFSAAQRLPDLRQAGFEPVAARLLSTEQGAAAMVVYQNADGQKVSFYIRPPGPNHKMLPPGSRQDGELQAAYWSGPGFNYAVVSPAGPMAQTVLNQLHSSF
ncbi:anti-sigma factor family protein [Pseudomonas typographi]|uniref:Anti-sigma factor n=1 Tax=Pseudomonas typographi TaxID=2715964 RepID=A0ABR7Z9P1_9PSED|nr:anti-sigma factor [Pseudomonas typographi]MBD1555129.1 anti-sigma factor [Pseudomonas typographi]MBD1590152.1 anti-sigma factor [Pseudomonas typographi]MBD1602187.1 anti-sigma factor [Pseudomonas typographi]